MTIKTTKKTIRKIKSKPLRRTLEFNRAEVNEEKRIVPVVFSTEEPVSRWFGNEILDHSEGSVRLDRLKEMGSALWNHNSDKPIGVPEDIRIDTDKKGRAVIRFGKSAKAEEVFQDVRDGIVRGISVGYRIHEMETEKADENGVDTYRATDWEPYEISFTPIPADTASGVGRAEGESENEIKIKGGIKEMEKCNHCQRDIAENMLCACEGAKAERSAPPPVSSPAPIVNVVKVQEEAARKATERATNIVAMGDQYGCRDLASKFLKEGKSVDELRDAILKDKFGGKTVNPGETPELGMSRKEVEVYSIVRAMRLLADGKALDGLEKEASDATAKIARKSAKGFFIPQDVMARGKRDLSAGVAPKGGYTVGTDVLGSEMIEILRNKTLVSMLGAKTLSGLVGNLSIPRITGGAQAYWLPETGGANKSDQTFGSLGLTPHRLVGQTKYSKELLMQSSIDVESFVRADLMTILALEKDRAALNGTGADGQPRGIINTTGIKGVTFGAAPTWPKVVDFETQIESSNANSGQRAYLTTPAVKGAWKTTPKVSAQPQYLWEGLEVNGYRAEATNQVPDNKVIFGNWDDLIMAEWAGIDVVVNPYSDDDNGLIKITITLWTDIGVRHAVSFCVSTDAGNQS